MARLARVVAPGIPHHVTQRGNRRQAVFFSDDDYAAYLDLLKEGCEAAKVEVWAYCLMPNHVHMILVPESETGLRGALAETHRRYSRRVNKREGWTGYLFQGRFGSAPIDESHLSAGSRYIELAPVRAGITRQAEDWRWSSAKAHLTGRDDALVKVKPLLDRYPDWRSHLSGGLSEEELTAMRRAERTGRPLGSKVFISSLEEGLGRSLAKQKPGRRPAGPIE